MIESTLLKYIGYSICQERIPKLQVFLTSLPYPFGEFDILAAFALLQTSSKNKAITPNDCIFSISNMLNRIKGIDNKKAFITALQKLTNQRPKQVTDHFVVQVQAIKSIFIFPNYYQQIFNNLYYKFITPDQRISLYFFQILYMIYIQLKHKSINSQAFDQPIVFFILFRYFFVSLLNVQITNPTQQAQFDNQLSSIVEIHVVSSNTQAFYQKKAQQILKVIFKDIPKSQMIVINTINSKRLLKIVDSMKTTLQIKLEGNSKAMSELSYLDQKPAPTAQQNTYVTQAAQPFIF